MSKKTTKPMAPIADAWATKRFKSTFGQVWKMTKGCRTVEEIAARGLEMFDGDEAALRSFLNEAKAASESFACIIRCFAAARKAEGK